jgi:tRNA A37 N6-isopentenylltransferase MiaA
MTRATKNLTAPYSVRLRHDQERELLAHVERMTPAQINKLREKDRSLFRYPEVFKNTGQKTNNPMMLLVRLALDEYITKLKQDEHNRQNPGLFDGLDEP